MTDSRLSTMLALRQFIESLVGEGAPLSMAAAAAQLGYDGPYTAREFATSAQSDVDGEFTTLPIETAGSGGWRADRLRIYFFVQGMGQIPVATHFTQFGLLFPQLFNGVGGDVVHVEGLTENIATAFYRHDKPMDGEPTLQFTVDARVWLPFLDAPDLHDDWVGFVHQDAAGFAVQTLKRNFSDPKDVAFGATVAVATVAAGGAVFGPVGANPFVAIGGGMLAAAVNRSHFLAGRRSWRIGLLPPVQSALLPGLNGSIYYLETAAIDRFSSWVVDLTTATGGLGDVAQQTATVWSNLLRNYAAYGATEFAYDTDISGWEEAIGAVAGTPFARHEGGVFIDQAALDSRGSLLAEPWVQAIIADHPGLGDQL